ncbi:MAG: PCMD domain-containing protein [Alistipes finegoldii]|uniref:PCMD domain-containing protein n=1 Tax=Alistipes finegoldii TaxID=214856 RepID=UPI00399F7550
MKKQVSLLTLTAALLLGACSTYEEVPATSGDGATAVGFLADIAPREQSRADINVDFGTGLTGTWNGEDNLGVLANDFSKLLQFTYTTDSKAFTGSLFGSAGTWAYRAFYPHNGNATVSGTTVTVPFSALRTQNGNKYNSEFDIMAADAITHNNAKPGKTPEGNAVKFNLHRITSILALKLQGGAASEKIASVMLTSKKPIASEKLTFTVPSDPNATYDPSAITPKLVVEGTSAMGSPISINSEHITVTYADGTAPSADYSETFFNVLPDDSYGDLTFSACTDKGNAASFTITRTTPVVANWVYTVERTASFTKAAAPTVKWIGHEDLTTPTELLESGNSANIRVSAPGGIKSMQVDITSSVLTTPMEGSEQNLLEAVKLAPSMELTNPANNDMAAALAGFGFPTPAQLLNQQHVYFQIGGLIDMLAMVCAEVTETTNSDFKFTVTDNAGQKTVITLKYVKTVVSPITYNNDADLWANTASFTLNIPADATSVSVQYRIKGQTTWNDADITANADGSRTAKISPTWTEGTNDAGLTIYTVDPKTGIFARKSYEYRLLADGATVASGEFTPKNNLGDVIPNAGMESWSTKSMKKIIGSTNVPYPNAVKYEDATGTDKFWDSGNNGYMTSSGTDKLCTQATYPGMVGDYCAQLAAKYAVIAFAAGNLYTGDFVMDGTVGYAQFGQPYTYSARPAALKLKYAAEIGEINRVKNDPPVSTGIDKGRIFVCIVEWSDRHAVQSGTSVDKTTFWDPETVSSLNEGKIIGYGSAYITESHTGSMKDLELPIVYYEKTDKAPTSKYTLVISTATSYLGDYLTGCDTNKLWVDDFKWVY